MSETDTTTIYDPEHWVHRRTEVDAIAYDGTEHARRAIVAWVVEGGGAAESRATGQLLILGARGWLPAVPGRDHVVRSIDVPGRGREFFPMGHDVLTTAYDRGENYGAVLTRDQGAAMVVAADDLVAEAAAPDCLRVRLMAISGQLAGYVHQLAASTEALR